MAKVTVADVPHMLKMWDYELNNEKPEAVSASCTDKKYWKCPVCGYHWPASPKARKKGSGKCPCHESNKAIMRGINDVLTIVKGLIDFIDENNDFEELYKQGVDSSLPVNFKCDECGRKWNDKLRTMIRKDRNGGYVTAGCPHYNKKHRVKSTVPFCTEVDAIMKFWDDDNPMNPAIVRSNSPDHAHFICKKCRYDWTTEIRVQAKGTGKCMCCELQRVVQKDINDLFTLIPESRKYYDFSKNKDIDIYSITIRNQTTMIDWKCPDCGKEWQSVLAHRVKGKKGNYSFHGCQDCYINKRKMEITPVAAVPRLMKYWNISKNKTRGLDPNLTSAYSNAQADWRCKKCGCEWESKIKSRMNSDIECPHCDSSRMAVIKGKNDVLTVCPEFASIYDFEYNEKRGIDIYKLSAGSSIEVHCKCQKCGNEWDSPINRRVRKNNDGDYRFVDCSKCSHQLFRKTPYSVEFPVLEQMYSQDLNEISIDDIRGTEAILKTHYYWNCLVCGETFEATMNMMKNSYESSTKGCPYCSRTKLRSGESFAGNHPKLMDEYNPNNTLNPYHVFPNCKDTVEWICRDCGHHWDASFALRHAGWGNCPVCNEKILVPEKNSLKVQYPDIAKRWSNSNNIGPESVLPTSYDWFRWICSTCSGEYGARIKDIVEGIDECPYCKGTKVLPGFNSFAHKHPDLVAEMDELANYLLPVSPDEVSDDSNYKFWFTCKNDPKHKYPMSPRTRLMFQKRHREPCLYCRGRRRKLNHFVSFEK